MHAKFSMKSENTTQTPAQKGIERNDWLFTVTSAMGDLAQQYQRWCAAVRINPTLRLPLSRHLLWIGP
jgi:hypothetical protein